MRLPGTCIICREPVVWNGRFWKDRTRGVGRRLVCPVERAKCGAVMPGRGNWRRRDGEPGLRQRCARGPGHRSDHRSEYALANARNAQKAAA